VSEIELRGIEVTGVGCKLSMTDTVYVVKQCGESGIYVHSALGFDQGAEGKVEECDLHDNHCGVQCSQGGSFEMKACSCQKNKIGICAAMNIDLDHSEKEHNYR